LYTNLGKFYHSKKYPQEKNKAMSETPNINVFPIDSLPKEILERRWPNLKWFDPELEGYVRTIIKEVKSKGDEALLRFTERFDGARLSVANLRVTQEEIDAAYERVKKEWISSLSFLKDRIEYLEKQQLERVNFESESSGVKIYYKVSPIRSVGCYVPGGGAAYSSTLIMTATPAKLVGVRRVVVCSPPDRNGQINPLTLVAADLCRVDEIYKVGGAQAIAALSYGTGLIKPVEKIVGPGNRYVTAAKTLVSRDVATDAPAGPTEILIVADGSADPRLIALDLISQAEHGTDSIPILATLSQEVASKVVEEIQRIVSPTPEGEVVGKALSTNGLIILCGSLEEAVDFANEFAPEHVEIVTEDPMMIAKRIESAGLVLIGPYTPVSASDYAFGTNHVLPTGGLGHIFSGLSIFDFVKRVSIVECSKEGLLRIRNNVKALAEAEGFLNHALAVEGRFELGKKE